jgi:hypothetical protein
VTCRQPPPGRSRERSPRRRPGLCRAISRPSPAARPNSRQLIGTLAAAAVGGEVAGLCAIDGMAGIGKITLAVHAAHQLARDFPDGQFFLPLHAHTPGQRPVDPADALTSLLQTAGVGVPQIPPGLEARAGPVA